MNIFIVHYNTPLVTDACIKSINKHCKDTKIYLLDNSDKQPFINSFDNVKIFDNTKRQLYKQPEYTKFGISSLDHEFAVQWFFDNFEEDFILLDSDVIVKKDFSSIIDQNKIYVSSEIIDEKRITPQLCYINLPFCKALNIKFSYPELIMNYKYSYLIGYGDTGAQFYIRARKYDHTVINIYDYIIHLNGGSWKKQFSKETNYDALNEEITFINKNKYYWDGQN